MSLLVADCDEVGELAVRDGAKRDVYAASPVFRRLQRGQWDQLCRLSEILDRASQEVHLSSTKWTSQPEPVNAKAELSAVQPPSYCPILSP